MSEPSDKSRVFGADQQPNATPGVQGTSASAEPAIQFKSSAIGTVVARQEDPFKEHKARAAEKKKQNDKIRKRVLIILGVILVLLLLGLGIWWIVSVMKQQPEAEEGFWQTEEGKDTQSTAQEIYDAGREQGAEDEPQEPSGNDQEVEDFFATQREEAATPSACNQAVLSELIFYSNNARPDLAINAAGKICDKNALSDDELRMYCGYIYNAAQSTGQGDNLLEECEDLLEKLPEVIIDGEG